MKIAHLSDLHFGTEIPGAADALRQSLSLSKPDLVVVSGDFTQTAIDKEFMASAEFLKTLNVPVFSVPGNHDVPRYNWLERFFDPFSKYKTFINPDLSPVLEQEGVCIAGINTARRALLHWNWANGAVSAGQLDWLKDVYSSSAIKTRVCVMHHPVHKAEGNILKTVVFGGATALQCLTELRVDLVLTGHVHHASITTAEKNNHKTIFLSASTALSHRLREQTNGYNIITFGERGFDIEIHHYRDGTFTLDQRYSNYV